MDLNILMDFLNAQGQKIQIYPKNNKFTQKCFLKSTFKNSYLEILAKQPYLPTRLVKVCKISIHIV